MMMDPPVPLVVDTCDQGKDIGYTPCRQWLHIYKPPLLSQTTMKPTRTPAQTHASYARLEKGGILKMAEDGKYVAVPRGSLPGLFQIPAGIIGHMATGSIYNEGPRIGGTHEL